MKNDNGEKIWKISVFVLAQLTNVTDGRTDGQTTPRACIYRAYAYASRGNKTSYASHTQILQKRSF